MFSLDAIFLYGVQFFVLARTCIVTVAMLAGDIGQSGLVPGRAPVHSISTFYVPGNIVVTNPPPWAPIGGGVKSPEISPLGRPAGGDELWGFPKNFFSETFDIVCTM